MQLKTLFPTFLQFATKTAVCISLIHVALIEYKSVFDATYPVWIWKCMYGYNHAGVDTETQSCYIPSIGTHIGISNTANPHEQLSGQEETKVQIRADLQFVFRICKSRFEVNATIAFMQTIYMY